MNRAPNNAAIKERRYSIGELRVKSDASGKRKIVGYAAKFKPARSENLGGFFEELDPHCFDACLASNPDVRALWNHDANHVLGRSTAGTLHLSVDSIGLFYEIDPPESEFARSLIESISRGDVSSASFGFILAAGTDADIWREENGVIIRTVLKAELLDVSPVTFPAYPEATTSVRANFTGCPIQLRSKLKRDWDDDSDVDCDPDSADYDPDNEDCEDRGEDCRCECRACAIDGDCSACNVEDCDEETCSCEQSSEVNTMRSRLRLMQIRHKHEAEVETEALRTKLSQLAARVL